MIHDASSFETSPAVSGALHSGADGRQVGKGVRPAERSGLSRFLGGTGSGVSVRPGSVGHVGRTLRARNSSEPARRCDEWGGGVEGAEGRRKARHAAIAAVLRRDGVDPELIIGDGRNADATLRRRARPYATTLAQNAVRDAGASAAWQGGENGSGLGVQEAVASAFDAPMPIPDLGALRSAARRVGLAAGPAGSRVQVLAEEAAVQGRPLGEALRAADAFDSVSSATRSALRTAGSTSVLGGVSQAQGALRAAARAGLSASSSAVALPRPRLGGGGSESSGRGARGRAGASRYASMRRTRLGYMA